VTRRAPFIFALLLALVTLSCGRPPRPVTEPAPPLSTSAARLRALHADLTALVDRPPANVGIWAALVRSLETDEPLFAINEKTPLMPASTMKIVTLAVAAEKLGWDYVYDTKLVTSAPVEAGTLNGDLVIVGSGDPSISWRDDVAPKLLDAWVRQVQAAGIRRVEGRIVGDDRVFDAEGLGKGWMWDDLASAFAAPVSGLQFNEDVADVAFRPGPAIGAPILIDVAASYSGLAFRNLAITGPSGSDAAIDGKRDPGSGTVIVTGSLPLGGREIVRRIPVVKPAAYFAGAVRAALIAKGVSVAGPAVALDEAIPSVDADHAPRIVAAHTSPPLSALAATLMKISDNLYAETFLKTVGRGPGRGTTVAGAEGVRTVLGTWGIAGDRYHIADGSGVSRYNYLTSELLVTILTRMHREPRHKPFLDTLPIAGVDGTLANRMKDTRAAGNARAKTGSLSNARALSGYVTTLDGEPLVFSIVANNFLVPAADIEKTIDAMVARLANFTRK
jgi:D-alanyl-D-alanine carboxypeptidase/D-alanyl-D-alanine-endopeptidase (penicillin-binding protein 4)